MELRQIKIAPEIKQPLLRCPPRLHALPPPQGLEHLTRWKQEGNGEKFTWKSPWKPRKGHGKWVCCLKLPFVFVLSWILGGLAPQLAHYFWQLALASTYIPKTSVRKVEYTWRPKINLSGDTQNELLGGDLWVAPNLGLPDPIGTALERLLPQREDCKPQQIESWPNKNHGRFHLEIGILMSSVEIAMVIYLSRTFEVTIISMLCKYRVGTSTW